MNDVEQRLANFFYKEADSKYLRCAGRTVSFLSTQFGHCSEINDK